MKRILNIFLLLLGVQFVAAQGIEFENSSFREALQKAKKENKLIFMDCYTVWCGPCKFLEKKVFPQKKVGDFFNANFINVKVDMEKGEGIELQNKFEVKSFPTLLFIDQNGQVVHKKIGAPDANGLIELGKEAMNSEKNISYFTQQYKKGNRSPKFMWEYMDRLMAMSDMPQARKIGDEFLKDASEEELFTPGGGNIICYTGVDYGTKMFDFVTKNRIRLGQTEGLETVHFNSVIQLALWQHMQDVAENTEKWTEIKKKLNRFKKEYSYAEFGYWEETLKIKYHYTNKQYAQWYKTYDDYLQKRKKEKGEKKTFNSYCNLGEVLFRNTEMPAKLYSKFAKKMESFAKQEVGMPYVYQVLAKAYLKSQQKEKALQTINTYLDIQKKAGEEIRKRTLQLKKEIDEM